MSITDFSSHLFWDVDISTIDLEKHKEYVVHRVLEYGLMKDFILLNKIFSLEQIKDITIKLRNLDDRTLNFIAIITKTPLEKFRCYTTKQSPTKYWVS
jgi:hypothetical protein